MFCVVTFALPTCPPHVLLFTETLASPRVTLGGLAAVLVALTRLTEAIPRVTIVAWQAGVAVPSSSVPQTGQALPEQYQLLSLKPNTVMVSHQSLTL